MSMPEQSWMQGYNHLIESAGGRPGATDPRFAFAGLPQLQAQTQASTSLHFLWQALQQLALPFKRQKVHACLMLSLSLLRETFSGAVGGAATGEPGGEGCSVGQQPWPGSGLAHKDSC